MTDADVCRNAAAYLREHGLLKGWVGVHGGPRCMVGALMSALRAVYPEPKDGRPTSGDEHGRSALQRIAAAMSIANMKLYSDRREVTTEDAARMLEQTAVLLP